MDDPDPTPDGFEEGLLTSTWERRGQPHRPCFAGWAAEACFSAVPGALLEIEVRLDILEKLLDDDVEEDDGDKDG